MPPYHDATPVSELTVGELREVVRAEVVAALAAPTNDAIEMPGIGLTSDEVRELIERPRGAKGLTWPD
jgi:hypothetical protein